MMKERTMNRWYKAFFTSTILTVILFGCAKVDISEASFPSGKDGLDNYLRENFSWKQGQLSIEGKVYVKFIVGKEGEISGVSVIRGLCESCDKEAIRLVEECLNGFLLTNVVSHLVLK